MQQVYVLVIDHRHGTDVTVHATEEGAHSCLDAYCREWWDGEMKGRVGYTSAPPPDDSRECVRRYFEAVTDESFTINQRGVAP